jgi:hypothetical protein
MVVQLEGFGVVSKQVMLLIKWFLLETVSYTPIPHIARILVPEKNRVT